jgi:6-phosphogluconolactonase
VTSPTERLTYPDVGALSRAAAEIIAEVARTAVAARGRFTIALSGGNTPRTLYRCLASAYRRRLPWDAVWVYFGDERCVPPDHPDSNYGMARDALLAQIPGLESRVARIQGELPAARAAAHYGAILERDFAASSGTFDVLLLGVGTDGHTASLFPGSQALEERRHLAVATEAPPTASTRERITLTFPVLDRAATTLILCAGADKKEILEKIHAAGPDAPARYPIMRITARDRLCWLLDRAATSEEEVRPETTE